MENEKDLLTLYKNYIFALQTREEFGEQYGDTDEIIKMYEDILGIKSNKNEDEIYKIKSKGE